MTKSKRQRAAAKARRHILQNQDPNKGKVEQIKQLRDSLDKLGPGRESAMPIAALRGDNSDLVALKHSLIVVGTTLSFHPEAVFERNGEEITMRGNGFEVSAEPSTPGTIQTGDGKKWTAYEVLAEGERQWLDRMRSSSDASIAKVNEALEALRKPHPERIFTRETNDRTSAS